MKHTLHHLSEEGAVPCADDFPSFTPKQREPYWKRLGGGSLAVSLLVHGLFAVVALLLIKFAVERPLEEPPIFTGTRGVDRQPNQPRRKPLARSQSQASRIVVVGPRTALTIPALPTVSIAQGPICILPIDPSATSFGGRPRVTGPATSGPKPGKGPAGGIPFLPPLYRSRCSPQERLTKLKENGGNEDCERAVVKALDWLKTQQSASGAWGTAHHSAMTGLAMLCYFGHCETADSPFYGTNVMSGVTYLLDLAGKNSGFLTDNLGRVFSTYEHGIATYALGETYSFSKMGKKEMPCLRETYERGVEIILENQTPNGGWSYGGNSQHYDKSGPGDLSVTGWQFQALKAAKHTNLKIAGLEKSMKRASDFLQSKVTSDGGVGSSTRRGEAYGQYTMTGVGVLGMQTLPGGAEGKVNKGLRFLGDEFAKDPCDWNKNANLYCWYYNTQACFQKGGKEWETWNNQCRDQLLKNQNPDGSYAQETGTAGAATSAAAGADAAIYRTCICTLMLEVYYRYLKVGGGAP